MNRRARTTQWRTCLVIVASLVLCIGMGTPKADAAVDTTGNNFTMLDAGGGFIGGTNDVNFTWDGTTKASVDASGQVSNATISSTCPFFGKTWDAHDVAIYGPGTYTVYDGCAPGSPGCGSGNAVTFTVGVGQLAGHMLFYWGGSDNIDVVDIWETGAFAPSSLWTGLCGSNAGTKVWDWMSTDWDGDGINGAPMTDGPFAGSNANFNLMGLICSCPVCDDGNACNGVERCDQANSCVCAAGTPKNCDDADACTTDSCDTVSGNCVHTAVPNCGGPCYGQPNGTACDDGNLCTTGDACANNVCTGTLKTCDDGNQCTADSCTAATGACSNLTASLNGKPCDDGDGNVCTGTCGAGVCAVGAAVNCDDSDGCTSDTCDPAAGCMHFSTPVCYSTRGNNFTMLTSAGGFVGGTNDVAFTWDGTCNSSVATAVVNAAIHSDEPFFGTTWAAHDVVIYCPGGPYTIYAGCAAGNANCGTGASYTFTVGPDQLAGHMLFYWNGSDNIDLVNIWEQGPFAGKQSFFITPYLDNGYYCQTPMCDGSANGFTKVWDMASTDWEGNGVSGRGFIDGPFVGFNGNFNIMSTIVDKCAGIDCTPFDYDYLTKNVCQTGACDPATGQCVFTAANEGGVCSDFQDCTTGDTCVSGVCVSGPAQADGAACDCGYGACYTGAVCTGGACSCGTQKLCPTIDKCTYNVCDKTTGECVASAKCNDTDQGTTDSCNASTGACTYTPIGGYAPQILVADSIAPTDDLNLPFGDVAIRTASTQTVTVINSGNANLKITGITASPAPFYNVVGKDLCSNKSVAPGGTCTFSVRFMPLLTGASTGSVVIPSNVSGTPTVAVTLSGNSVCDPATCDDGNDCTDDSQDAECNCIHSARNCEDGNLCTSDSCDPATGACIHTDKAASCDDGTACTTDSCNLATGNCVYTPTPRCIDTSNNNFTMIAAIGDLIGGTNDVRFTWDGTLKTSVAVSGQSPNATLSSTCPFFTNTWFAHDVAIYGPGTHTVYADCAPGSPGCGSGLPITFTVNAGEIGGHMLFNWGTNTNIDVVDIWTPNAAFEGKICVKEAYPVAPGLGMCGLALPCGDNPANKVWDMMSRDVNGDGNNGNPMIDGPFLGFNANFNLMACGDCNDNNACTTDTCNPGVGCVNTPNSCDDGNECTADACDPVSGCVQTPLTCSDMNACTTDACDPATGTCFFTTISCDDGNACTADSCDPASGCVNTAVSCDDNNVCTADSCDAATGCVNTAISCNDNNACTADSCDAATGCVNTAISCDDNNACTVDSCDPAIGCAHPAVVCAPGEICLPDGACSQACPAGAVKSVKIRGGGQKPGTVDMQIQTEFIVLNGGCIVDYTKSTVTVTPGTILQFNCKAGTGPHPTHGTWKGNVLSTDSNQIIECPQATGEVGKLILDNKLGGGKDTDRMTISVQ